MGVDGWGWIGVGPAMWLGLPIPFFCKEKRNLRKEKPHNSCDLHEQLRGVHMNKKTGHDTCNDHHRAIGDSHTWFKQLVLLDIIFMCYDNVRCPILNVVASQPGRTVNNFRLR